MKYLIIIPLLIFFSLSCGSDDEFQQLPSIEELHQNSDFCTEYGYDFEDGWCYCPENKLLSNKETNNGRFFCREPEGNEFIGKMSGCVCEEEKFWAEIGIAGPTISESMTVYNTVEGKPWSTRKYVTSLIKVPMDNGLDSIYFPMVNFSLCGNDGYYAHFDSILPIYRYTARFSHPDTILGNVWFRRQDERGNIVEENCKLDFFR